MGIECAGLGLISREFLVYRFLITGVRFSGREHLTEEDLRTFRRERGYMRYDEVELVVLETDGQVSVIPNPGSSGGGVQSGAAQQ